jgi:hypothetical protein
MVPGSSHRNSSEMGIDLGLVVEEHRGVGVVMVLAAAVLVDMATDLDNSRPSTTTSTTTSRPSLPNFSFKVISKTASTEGGIIMVGAVQLQMPESA